MQPLARMMVVLGAVLLGTGLLLLWLGPRADRLLGGLPGDLHWQRGNVSVHFPVVTCIVASVVLTLLLRLLGR